MGTADLGWRMALAADSVPSSSSGRSCMLKSLLDDSFGPQGGIRGFGFFLGNVLSGLDPIFLEELFMNDVILV